jgi:hypothetical protein
MLISESRILRRSNNSRACVKTPVRNFGNNQILDMGDFDEMSRRVRWSKNEFSHGLTLEPTPTAPFEFMTGMGYPTITELAEPRAGRRGLDR